METREIAAVRGLIRQSPVASAALIFGGLGITGAPPLAVFLSEFSILKAGLNQRHYLATGLLAIFIVIAFFGVMLHINRMVFGAREGRRCRWTNIPAGRKRTTLAVQLPPNAASGGCAVLVLGFIFPSRSRFADAGRGRLDKMNRMNRTELKEQIKRRWPGSADAISRRRHNV